MRQLKIRGNAALAGKICLLVILLLVGLTVLGCVGIKTSPQGGSGVTIADGTIFLCPALKQAGGFSCSAQVVEGKLVALDISNGSRLWDEPLGTSGAIYGTPAVGGDLVYVGTYRYITGTGCAPGVSEGKIYALNASSGAVRWVYPREGTLEPIVSGVVVALDKVYFGCSDGKVYALDAATGDLQPGFPFVTGDKIWATPAVDGETLYIGSFDKKLYAIDAITGEQKWEKPFETDGAIASTPLVYNNTVYFGSFDRYFYAVDAATGSPKWKFPAEPAEKWFWTRAVAYNGTVYVGCFDGKVYALDAETGDEVVDAIDLGSPVYSWPVLVDGRVIVATEEGKIYAIDTANNQEKLLADVGEAIYAPLCTSDGVIYVYSQAQNLYALNVESGATLWSLSLK
jgi:outer membrane protein assembly factor BamB